jgi:hypothetical protein
LVLGRGFESEDGRNLVALNWVFMMSEEGSLEGLTLMDVGAACAAEPSLRSAAKLS